MPDDDVAQILSEVGPRLRALRKSRQVSLDQLSSETGISASTLSRLESGRRRATLDLLLPLAQAHGVPLDELVPRPSGDPRVKNRPFTRWGITFIPLTRRQEGLQAYKEIIPPRATHRDRRPEQSSHEGYEWLYVIAGKLWLALADEDYLLEAGEAVEFDTSVLHGFANAGSTSLELLTLIGPQGERLHIRARH